MSFNVPPEFKGLQARRVNEIKRIIFFALLRMALAVCPRSKAILKNIPLSVHLLVPRAAFGIITADGTRLTR